MQGEEGDDSFNESSISYSGMLFSCWVRGRRELGKKGGIVERKKEEDELMPSQRDYADLSQSYIYRKKIRQGSPVPFKSLQGDASAKLVR